MPKPRVLHWEFWRDPDLADLSDFEKLLLAGIFTRLADDHGIVDLNPRAIESELFPFRKESRIAEICGSFLKFSEMFRSWVWYRHGTRYLLWIGNYDKWQQIRYKAKSIYACPSDAESAICEFSEVLVHFSKFTKTDKFVEHCGNLREISENFRSVGLGLGLGLGLGNTPLKAPPSTLGDEAPPDVEEAWAMNGNGATPKAKQRKRKPSLTQQQAKWWDCFWSEWPMKVAKSDAMQAFSREITTPDVFAAMMAGLRSQKASMEARIANGDPVKYPQGWLTSHRWEDQTLPPSPANRRTLSPAERALAEMEAEGRLKF